MRLRPVWAIEGVYGLIYESRPCLNNENKIVAENVSVGTGFRVRRSQQFCLAPYSSLHSLYGA